MNIIKLKECLCNNLLGYWSIIERRQDIVGLIVRIIRFDKLCKVLRKGPGTNKSISLGTLIIDYVYKIKSITYNQIYY